MTKEELLKKLKALAEKGVGGEKENAQRMLAKLMKKYDISAEDLENEERDAFFYPLKKEQIKLFHQVAYSVIGKEYKGIWNLKRSPRKTFIYATKAESLEIVFRFKIYWKAWEEELRVFYRAFLHVNKIFPPTDNKSEDAEASLDTDELAKMMVMMGGIEKQTILKQIEG